MIIPMVLIGVSVCLATFRFCFINKPLSQKLRSVSMYLVGFAMMGPIFIIIDIFQYFTQMQSQSSLDLDGKGWHFAFAGIAQIIALTSMFVLEIFDMCF